MISLRQHKQINDLLSDWDTLAKLYETIQTDKNLTVQVNGNYRDEFVPGAKKEAKILLKAKAERIKADLQQLEFDIATLQPLREVLEVKKDG